jgi:hypothetical protein
LRKDPATELEHLKSLLSTGADYELITVIIAVHENGGSILDLDEDAVADLAGNYQIFTGATFCDLYDEALHQIFEDYYPEEYKLTVEGHCPFIQIDRDALDGPEFATIELNLGEQKILAVRL